MQVLTAQILRDLSYVPVAVDIAKTELFAKVNIGNANTKVDPFSLNCINLKALNTEFELLYIKCQSSFILVSYWLKEDHVKVTKFNC